VQPESGDSGGAKATSGMAPNLAAALSYVLGIITGVVFLMVEKDPFVRFHAYQSIFLSVAWFAFWIVFTVISSVLGMIPFVGFLAVIFGLLVSLVLGLGSLILVLVLIIKAYNGERFKVPYIGNMAEKYAAGQ
jgi:uncharacterized membrane protein